MTTNWKQLKQEQEQRIAATLRQLFGLGTNDMVVAQVTDTGCTIHIGNSPLSTFEFEWAQVNPGEIVCRATSGSLRQNPPSLTLTPVVISLSVLNSICRILIDELGVVEEPAASSADVVDVNLEAANE